MCKRSFLIPCVSLLALSMVASDTSNSASRNAQNWSFLYGILSELGCGVLERAVTYGLVYSHRDCPVFNQFYPHKETENKYENSTLRAVGTNLASGLAGVFTGEITDALFKEYGTDFWKTLDPTTDVYTLQTAYNSTKFLMATFIFLPLYLFEKNMTGNHIASNELGRAVFALPRINWFNYEDGDIDIFGCRVRNAKQSRSS